MSSLQTQLQEALRRDQINCLHVTDGIPRGCKKNHRKCIAAAILAEQIHLEDGSTVVPSGGTDV